jgi:tetratricopeptide (TPR) repeat protein
METFTWGRMNEEDVFLDYYTVRTFSVIRFRNSYTRLALALLEQGDRERAIGVLDRCMALAPSRVLPYDQYISGITLPDGRGGTIHHEGIVEAYYLCGETEKANAILKEYYNQLIDEYSYFSALKPRHRATIEQEINEVLFQLEELNILMRQFGQEELMMELGLGPADQLFSPLPGEQE